MFEVAVLAAHLWQAPGATPPVSPPLAAATPACAGAYVPQRVYDTRRRAFTDFESMLADLARADVVLVGEQHDDPNTHRLEVAILEGLHRRNVRLTLSLEVFERDTQTLLDAYLAGTADEKAFLEGSRPWTRYTTDYRPLVELAKAHGWPVVASNVPRGVASAVAKNGKTALEELPESDRRFLARDLHCPHDRYYERFTKQMSSHPVEGQAGEPAADSIERYYWSQCVKDETMAESITAAFEQAGRPGTIVHYTGSFHSDFGLGTTDRVRRRLPGRRIAVVSVLPVPDLDVLSPDGEDLQRADYLLYTVGASRR